MKSTVRDVVETLILTVVIFLVVRAVVQNFKVEGRSMEPTLRNGQYLVINKAAYWHLGADMANKVFPGVMPGANANDAVFMFSEPHQSDIIVFRYPKDPTRDFIKRIIAVPGESVEIRQGKVYVNGKFIDEAYIDEVGNYSWGPRKMDPGEYFVLGDNRNNSSDSHVWGPVPRDNIIGRAWISYWPIDQLGFLTNHALAGAVTR